MILLVLLLGWFIFCAALLLWPGRSTQRSHLTRLDKRAEDGGDWSGAREPRRPRLPFWPARGAAVALPEETEPQMTGSLPGYSSIPQQPLRLEDGLA